MLQMQYVFTQTAQKPKKAQDVEFTLGHGLSGEWDKYQRGSNGTSWFLNRHERTNQERYFWQKHNNLHGQQTSPISPEQTTCYLRLVLECHQDLANASVDNNIIL